MPRHAAAPPFTARQQAAQGQYFLRERPGHQGYKGWAYRLEDRTGNLSPAIAEQAHAYFAQRDIAWHIHASHGLSSQVCCLNFLMPLATRPDRLARVIGAALGIAPPDMQPVEKQPDGSPLYVAFEWNGGGKDYLGEGKAGKRLSRGANSTSADAFVRFRGEAGDEALLIEWKYTESYGAPIPNAARGNGRSPNDTRRARYAHLAVAPNGPLRSDANLTLDDFFWEPFYQLARQQMLAFRIEADLEDPARRVRVLHISPASNIRLHDVTSASLQNKLQALGGARVTDAFDAFRLALAKSPDGTLRFVSRTTEAVFNDVLADVLAADPADPWASYLTARYTFLAEAA